MSGKFTMSDTLNTLKAIFEKHKNERVCVVGTMCCGKTTLLKQIPNCLDMDELAFANVTEEEAEILSQTPWTKEVGDTVDRIVYRNVKIKPNFPVFGTVIVDCEAVVYLDISDTLLKEHCEKRGADFEDALKIKEEVEKDWNNHKEKNEKNNKTFYYLTVTE